MNTQVPGSACGDSNDGNRASEMPRPTLYTVSSNRGSIRSVSRPEQTVPATSRMPMVASRPAATVVGVPVGGVGDLTCAACLNL